MKSSLIRKLHLIHIEGFEQINRLTGELMSLADSGDAQRLLSLVVSEMNITKNRFVETTNLDNPGLTDQQKNLI